MCARVCVCVCVSARAYVRYFVSVCQCVLLSVWLNCVRCFSSAALLASHVAAPWYIEELSTGVGNVFPAAGVMAINAFTAKISLENYQKECEI